MKTLVFGAGIIGSVYAAKLYDSGNDVTLLARGKRYKYLQQNGVIITEVISGKQAVSRVPIIEHLFVTHFYDLIIVAVRLDQLDSAIRELKHNASCSALLFMLNNPDSAQQLTRDFPHKSIILGFPGIGGTYRNNQIDYLQIKQQRTTIGNVDGIISDVSKEIKKMLQRAGFAVALSDNMPAWLQTHAVFITCVAAAIAKDNNDSIQLGKNKNSVRTMVKSINEGFVALQKAGISIEPANLKSIFMTMPRWFSVWYWQNALQGRTGTLAITPHVKAAQEEMKLLAEKVLRITYSSTITTPTLHCLLSTFIHSR